MIDVPHAVAVVLCHVPLSFVLCPLTFVLISVARELQSKCSKQVRFFVHKIMIYCI